MGDLESGFEEMQGVKLGYLVIKGKQMFPLSQVFTDLLKNIPRTTVHKRMDHLNVKKHHCDLEELRKLKAINSIAFHAAKCTLISREDVEALYFSCKTERVLKSNKRKLKIKPAEDIRLGKVHEDPDDGFWKEKVWLSLHSVPQTLSYQSRAGRQETVSRTDSNLPQIYSKKHRQNFETFTKPTCKTIKNYEKTQKRSNFVAFNQTHPFIRNAVNLQPALCQSAIAAQPKLACSSDLLHKRKRKRQSTGWQFCSRSKLSHQLLFVPKCCKSKVYNSSFNLDHDLYLNQQPSGIFQESCSSDTESSSLSERVNDDSDFGSSLSTTSISGTSDEEDDESFSESSGSSSDEESSSQSDSSSVSSQVSMQSIRFRRARFTSLNSKTPLLLQPTFHYNLQERPGTNGELSTSKDICEKKSLCGTTKFRDNRGGVALISSKFSTSATENPYIVSKGEEVTIKPGSFKFPDDPKTENLAGNRPKDRGLSCLNENKAFPQQRTSGHTNKCPEALISHCAQDNETVVSVSSNTNLLPSFHLKREIENGHCLKQQTPSKPIKTEPGEPFSASNSCNDVNSSVLTFNNVKIKLENTTDEYELATLNNGLLTKGNEPELQSQESTELKYIRSSSTLSGCNEGIAVHSKVSGNEGIHRTLKAPFPKIGEFRNGARVRKNYRTLALGCKSGNPRIPTRVYAKVDRSSLSVTNVDSKERPNESGMGMTKRKRVSSSGAAGKNTFNFMANFPFPPSLVLGSDGDLAPAYSLNCYRNNGLPHKSHPVWTWQLGGPVVPPPPSQRFRKC